MRKCVRSKNSTSQCDSSFTFVIDDLKKDKNRWQKVTSIDSALNFALEVAALQCTKFDWQFGESGNKKFEKYVINAIAVSIKITDQEVERIFFCLYSEWCMTQV